MPKRLAGHKLQGFDQGAHSSQNGTQRRFGQGSLRLDWDKSDQVHDLKGFRLVVEYIIEIWHLASIRAKFTWPSGLRAFIDKDSRCLKICMRYLSYRLWELWAASVPRDLFDTAPGESCWIDRGDLWQRRLIQFIHSLPFAHFTKPWWYATNARLRTQRLCL